MQVFTKCQFTVCDRHTFDQDIAFFNFVAGANDNLLVDAGAFVTADKVLWLVGNVAVFVFDDNFVSRWP